MMGAVLPPGTGARLGARDRWPPHWAGHPADLQASQGPYAKSGGRLLDGGPGNGSSQCGRVLVMADHLRFQRFGGLITSGTGGRTPHRPSRTATPCGASWCSCLGGGPLLLLGGL